MTELGFDLSVGLAWTKEDAAEKKNVHLETTWVILERCRVKRSLLSLTFLFILPSRTVVHSLGTSVQMSEGLLLLIEFILPKINSFKLHCKLDFSPYLSHWLSILEQAVTQTIVPKGLLPSAALYILPSFSPPPSPGSYYACHADLASLTLGLHAASPLCYPGPSHQSLSLQGTLDPFTFLWEPPPPRPPEDPSVDRIHLQFLPS